MDDNKNNIPEEENVIENPVPQMSPPQAYVQKKKMSACSIVGIVLLSIFGVALLVFGTCIAILTGSY